MSDPNPLTERSLDRAVFVQACESGWDPRTVVRQVVWREGVVHEEQLVFPTLRQALDYAREAFASVDGPSPGASEDVELVSTARKAS
jgi:hypothetical protein